MPLADFSPLLPTISNITSSSSRIEVTLVILVSRAAQHAIHVVCLLVLVAAGVWSTTGLQKTPDITSALMIKPNKNNTPNSE